MTKLPILSIFLKTVAIIGLLIIAAELVLGTAKPLTIYCAAILVLCNAVTFACTPFFGKD